MWNPHSTLIHTSELILCSTICVHSATRHNIHISSNNCLIVGLLQFNRYLTHWILPGLWISSSFFFSDDSHYRFLTDFWLTLKVISFTSQGPLAGRYKTQVTGVRSRSQVTGHKKFNRKVRHSAWAFCVYLFVSFPVRSRSGMCFGFGHAFRFPKPPNFWVLKIWLLL